MRTEYDDFVWKEPQQATGKKKCKTDSSPSLLDGFSSSLDCWRFRFMHQAPGPVIIRDYKFLQSFYFPQKYLSNKLSFSDKKKINCQKHFWPMLILASCSGTASSPCQGTGEGALARLLPAPGTNLQTHARTRLEGSFCCLHHNLSPSPHPTLLPPTPTSCVGSSLMAVLLVNLPWAPCRQTSLWMRVWNQVGSGWGGKLCASSYTTTSPHSHSGCTFSILNAVGQSCCCC